MKFLLIFIICSIVITKHPLHKFRHKKPSLFAALNSMTSFRFKQTPLTMDRSDFTKAILGNNDDIGQGPIYKKGWLKFLSYTSKSSNSYNEFTKNAAYYEQNPDHNFIKLPIHQNRRDDECGSLEIPDAYHFFFYLTTDTLYIVSARKNSLAKTIRVLHFKSSTPKNTDYNDYLIGVEDQGNYQEGYCFKLRVENCGLSEYLVLCSDLLTDKMDWMKRISILQMRCQSPEPHIVNQAIIQANIRGSSQYQSNYTENFHENIVYKASQKIDGKWMILQDWSTCTLACGGGTQTLHRLCIPPSDGGSPCEGTSIVNRSCNTEPCPNVRVVVDEKVAPTRVKMLRISKRPQRYETCIVKEGDLEVVKENLRQFNKSPRVPARVVLNNKTILVFESDDYQTVLFSMNLENLKSIENFSEDPEDCFVLKDCTNEKRVVLCGFSSGMERPSQQKREWIKQIYFFRDKCQDEGNLYTDEILLLKKRALEEEALERRANGHKDKEKMERISAKLEKLQNLAMIAAAKEAKYDKMAEQEEMEREEREEMELRKRYEEEKIKQEFSERQRIMPNHNDQHDGEREMEDEILEAKKEMKRVLREKKEKQQRRLEMMRRRAERRKHEIMDKIMMVKSKYPSNLPCKKFKNLDFKCFGEYSQQNMFEFCDKNFPKNDGRDENANCKDDENFCFMCCEAQLKQYEDQRDECDKMCDHEMLRRENEKNEREDTTKRRHGEKHWEKNETCHKNDKEVMITTNNNNNTTNVVIVKKNKKGNKMKF